MPDCFANTPDNRVLIANGINPMLRWDPLQPQAELAGVAAPTKAVVMSGSGSGTIVGHYTAYLRFVDQYGQYSSLSPVSSIFTAAAATGTITGASKAGPIVITSANHNLNSGMTIQVSGVFGNTNANGTWIVDVIDSGNFSLRGSTGNDFYQSGGIWIAGYAAITYNGCAIPQESKVVRRQVLRNTDGQATTYYVDIDTFDLTSSVFIGTNTDAQLVTQTPQAIFDTNGLALIHVNDPPPAHKSAVAMSQNRMFAAVDVDYTNGSVSVTFGSTTISGIGTEWPSSFVNRQIYVQGGDKPYLIDAIDPVGQTLTIHTPYLGPTDAFAPYAVRPTEAERNLVYFSEAALPESWSPFSSFALAEDGDLITGLMPKGAYLYILKRRHVYQFSFQDNPALDGFLTLSESRGCVNNRCYAIVEDLAFMLDELGVHIFDGHEGSAPISQMIQDLFTNAGNPYRINWAARKYFHCLHDPQRETIKWFVALGEAAYPYHALCYQYRYKNWWIEQYAVPIGASVLGRLNNLPQPYLGTLAKTVLASYGSTLDGVKVGTGTLRGTATGSSLLSLTDSSASFPSLSNVPLVIAEGRGKGQTRLIASSSATQLTVTQPWAVLPDNTSIYQVGGIQWNMKTRWFRVANEGDKNSARRIRVVFLPLPNPATIDLRVRLDRSALPYTWSGDFTSEAGNGIAVANGDTDLIGDLTKSLGYLQKRYDSHREFYADGVRYLQWEMAGVGNGDGMAIYEVDIEGVSL